MSRARRIYSPRSAAVEARGGRPVAVGRVAVEDIREDWMVEDRWWTDRPIRRRYFELVLANGRNAIVFCDLIAERWHSQ